MPGKNVSKKPMGVRRAPSSAKVASSQSNKSTAYVASSRPVRTTNGPQFQSRGSSIRVRHSEYFGGLNWSTSVFSTYAYPLNPGIGTLFPWLSQVASRYEKYCFRRLKFSFHTRAPTNTVGTVGMAFEYNATDSVPISLQQVLSYQDKTADAPWKDQVLELDPTMLAGNRYVRTAERVGQDLKTYDLGYLLAFADALSLGTSLVLLEVSYEVDLFTPQVVPGLGGRFVSGLDNDSLHLFGTAVTPDPEALLPFHQQLGSRSIIVFDQAFEGLLAFTFTGGSTLVGPVTMAGSGSATQLQSTYNSTTPALTVVYSISMYPGSTLSPSVSDMDVGTQITWYLAQGAKKAFSP